MLLKVLTEDNRNIHINLSFDLYGNLYFDVTNIKNHEYFDKPLTYSSLQINIDGRNNLYADDGEYTIIDSKNDKLSKFQLVEDHNLLHKKTKKELEIQGLNDKENNEYDYDVFDEYDVDQDNLDPEEEMLKYFPERAEFYMVEHADSDHMIDEDNINNYGYHNTKFNFSHLSSDVNVPIYNRENGDITSLYDTYVYQDGILCFNSSSKEEESIYTIKIYDDGIICLRPNGSYEQKYKITFTKNGNVLFIK